MAVVILLLKKTPDNVDVLRELLKDETAGDPVKGIKWTRKTVRRIARELLHRA